MRWMPVLAALALAGCLGAPPSPVRVVAYLPLADAEPGEPVDLAFYVESTSAFRQTLPLEVDGLPAGWSFDPAVRELTLNGSQSLGLRVSITPDGNATFGPHTLDVKVGNTRASVIVNVRDLGERRLTEGQGALLHYTLFLDNGTLFATSDKTAWDQPGIPHASNDAPEFGALKVYVGGSRGKPPPEPYNSTGCEGAEQPPCYHPVIPGFDSAIRGMVEGQTRAFLVPREQAYTVPGNETHPLYGQDLHFLVRLLRIDEMPTRACALPVCPTR